MKTILIIIFVLSFVSAQGQVTMERLPEVIDPSRGHFETSDTTIVLNKGSEICKHDWAEKREPYNGGMVNAVYTNPYASNEYHQFKICTRCLKHLEYIIYNKWIVDGDKYNQALKKLKP